MISESNSKWVRNGENFLDAFLSVGARFEQKAKARKFMVKCLLEANMETVEDGPISYDLTNATPLIPIVFSHGNSSTRTMNSCFLRDIASHGFIIFALDHVEGTCMHTKKADGTELIGKKESGDALYNYELKK